MLYKKVSNVEKKFFEKKKKKLLTWNGESRYFNFEDKKKMKIKYENVLSLNGCF